MGKPSGSEGSAKGIMFALPRGRGSSDEELVLPLHNLKGAACSGYHTTQVEGGHPDSASQDLDGAVPFDFGITVTRTAHVQRQE
jgi:hypothetical protein